MPRRGRGKFWNGVKNFFGKSKILSGMANLVPVAGPILSESIANLGYGKRRRRYGRRRGSGFFSKIKNAFTKVNNKLKDGKYISTYAPTISKVIGKVGEISGNAAIQKAATVASDIGNKAATMGYGRPRSGRRGGGKLPMNGMGRFGGGSLTPQGRLNAFVAKRLAMAR